MSLPPKSVIDHLKSRGLHREPDGSRSALGPPRLVKLPDSSRSSVAPRPGSDIAKTPDNLPVLTAFQDFLAAERRQARRRITVVTVFFLILIAGASTLGVYAGMIFYRQMQQDIGRLRAEIGAYKEDHYSAADRTESLAHRLEDESGKLRDDISRTAAEMATLRGDLEQRLTANMERLSMLSGTVQTLRDENASLSRQLADLSRPPVTLALKPLPQQDATAPREQQPRRGARDQLRTDTPATRQPPAQPVRVRPIREYVQSTITPRGSDRTSSWRFSIPE